MNNSSAIINNKKATVFYRSFFIVLFLFGLSISYCQESQVRHYQRNCSIDSVILPGQVFDSKLYLISFPDSLYSGGIISIKKLKIAGVKTKAEFNLSDNKYTVLKYTMNKRNKNV